MDFPRIPFTEDYELFSKLAELGKELADIHLLKSSRLSPPLARYQGGSSNDMVEFIQYDEDKNIAQINPDKHFEGISPELWNYHNGGYQVLHKYLKNRKGKNLTNPIHYCLVVSFSTNNRHTGSDRSNHWKHYLIEKPGLPGLFYMII